jgi:hypothetical protein
VQALDVAVGLRASGADVGAPGSEALELLLEASGAELAAVVAEDALEAPAALR